MHDANGYANWVVFTRTLNTRGGVQLVRWCYPYVPLVVGPCDMTAYHWTRVPTHTLLLLVSTAETFGESTALPCAGQPCNGHSCWAVAQTSGAYMVRRRRVDVCIQSYTGILWVR